MSEWFVVSNPAPCLPARTGCAPEYKTCWEEPPTAEEMAQVESLLKEIADLSAQGLTGAAVAISFYRRLTRPIQERVHPAFEYWGRHDPVGPKPGELAQPGTHPKEVLLHPKS